MTRAQAEAHVASLFALLSTQGHADYIGEPISQLAHCLQAAHFAERAGADAPTVIAALLHDVGQFVPLHEKRRFAAAHSDAKAAKAQADAEAAHKEDEEEEDVGAEMLTDGISVGRMGHDRLGEEWLRQAGWPRSVTSLVGAHVVAKR